MRRLMVIVAAMVLFGGLGAPRASAQTTDAVSVARGLIDAENSHNVAAAVNFFAPGAIVNLPTGTLVTRAEIQQWQQDLAAGNFHATTTVPVAVTPEVVTFSGFVALDLFRSLGLSSLDSTWQLTIQLGKITTFNFDFTPAATARLQAASGGGNAATTAAPPSGAAGAI
ncbi:MAG: nuclear transport factor 2 family protein, partial [Actinomycetota bacterium]|nr:nuclear transport factor 2 family protein [Actinomycetota bacterium]